MTLLTHHDEAPTAPEPASPSRFNRQPQPAGGGTEQRTQRQQRGGRFRNLPTARKLLVGFLSVALLMLAVGGMGLVQLHGTQQRLEAMNERVLEPVEEIGQIETLVADMRFRLLDLAIARGARKTEIRAQLADIDAKLDAALSSYVDNTSLTGVDAQLERLTTNLEDYRTLRDEELLPLAMAGDVDGFIETRDSQSLRPAQEVATAVNELLVAELAGADATVEQSRDAYTSSMWIMVALMLGAFALAVFLAVFIGRLVVAPLRRTVTVLEGLAAGRLDQRIEIESEDEVGQMGRALNSAMAQLATSMQSIGGNASALASSSEELSAVSTQMSGAAEESATQSNVVSAAAEQVSHNVQTVATGTEEMSASIREIAKNATDAAHVAAQAVQVARNTNESVTKLGESSHEIGNVIKVITSIAEQTNLLALNATIEAARAGDAGKGFAVVANEVKELAQETGKATEDIERRVQAIQADTEAAVAAIGQIATIIDQINDTQTTIASAVEEQTATTNEMSRNVSEAAIGSQDIASNISGVARAASEATTGAANTAQAADELARMAAELQQLVGSFRY